MARDKRNTAIYTAFDEVDANDVPTPEKGLLRAILLNAIADMNRDDEHTGRARAYFLSKEDDYIFSFQAICSYLNINPGNILVLVGLQAPPMNRKGNQKSDSEQVTSQSELNASLLEAAGRDDAGLT